MKNFLSIFCCVLCFSVSAQAIEEKDFLCKAFEHVQKYSDAEILEAFFLWDDYIGYKKGWKSAFPTIWKNLVNKKDEIYTISFKKMESYVPSEKKQKFKDFIKDTEEYERGAFARYLPTLETCSYNVREKLSHLKQKILDDEKNLFLKRTKGKKIHSKPLEYFTLINQPIQPSKEFIYEYKIGDIHDIKLRVLQVVPSGILVQADNTENDLLKWYGTSADKTLFVETKSNYVDQDLLQNGFFEYLGPKSYMNVLGNRTVHSFREISDPFKNIFLYKGTE